MRLPLLALFVAAAALLCAAPRGVSGAARALGSWDDMPDSVRKSYEDGMAMMDKSDRGKADKLGLTLDEYRAPRNSAQGSAAFLKAYRHADDLMQREQEQRQKQTQAMVDQMNEEKRQQVRDTFAGKAGAARYNPADDGTCNKVRLTEYSDPVACSGRGVCVSGSCVCNPKYGGTYCELDRAETEPSVDETDPFGDKVRYESVFEVEGCPKFRGDECGGRGACTAYGCDCAKPFTGPACAGVERNLEVLTQRYDAKGHVEGGYCFCQGQPRHPACQARPRPQDPTLTVVRKKVIKVRVREQETRAPDCSHTVEVDREAELEGWRAKVNALDDRGDPGAPGNNAVLEPLEQARLDQKRQQRSWDDVVADLRHDKGVYAAWERHEEEKGHLAFTFEAWLRDEWKRSEEQAEGRGGGGGGGAAEGPVPGVTGDTPQTGAAVPDAPWDLLRHHLEVELASLAPRAWALEPRARPLPLGKRGGAAYLVAPKGTRLPGAAGKDGEEDLAEDAGGRPVLRVFAVQERGDGWDLRAGPGCEAACASLKGVECAVTCGAASLEEGELVRWETVAVRPGGEGAMPLSRGLVRAKSDGAEFEVTTYHVSQRQLATPRQLRAGVAVKFARVGGAAEQVRLSFGAPAKKPLPAAELAAAALQRAERLAAWPEIQRCVKAHEDAVAVMAECERLGAAAGRRCVPPRAASARHLGWYREMLERTRLDERRPALPVCGPRLEGLPPAARPMGELQRGAFKIAAVHAAAGGAPPHAPAARKAALPPYSVAEVAKPELCREEAGKAPGAAGAVDADDALLVCAAAGLPRERGLLLAWESVARDAFGAPVGRGWVLAEKDGAVLPITTFSLRQNTVLAAGTFPRARVSDGSGLRVTTDAVSFVRLHGLPGDLTLENRSGRGRFPDAINTKRRVWRALAHQRYAAAAWASIEKCANGFGWLLRRAASCADARYESEACPAKALHVFESLPRRLRHYGYETRPSHRWHADKTIEGPHADHLPLCCGSLAASCPDGRRTDLERALRGKR